MTIHLQTITQALKDFVDSGVPAIRFAQKHNGNNLLNLSTIATFFSGVTATTAQYSFQNTTTTLDKVRTFYVRNDLSLVYTVCIDSPVY
jgi:hypothetical protein